MALPCLSAVVKHGILTKSITNSKSEEAKGIRFPTLPEVLQLCMQSDNWEVKDSCIELVGEVYQCCVQSGKLNCLTIPLQSLWSTHSAVVCHF